MPRRTFPLRIHIATLLVGLVVVVGGLIVGIAYSRMSAMLEQATDQMFERSSARIASEIDRLLQPAGLAIDLLRLHRIAQARSLEARLESVPFLAATLGTSHTIAAVYVGYRDGDFFLLRHLREAADRVRFAAPPSAAFLVQSRDRDAEGVARGRYLYLDERLDVVMSADRPDYADFDPRVRPWYAEAVAARGRIRTEPYAFFSNRVVGVTLALPTAGDQGVVGADVPLFEVSRILATLRPSPSVELALVDGAGRLIAHPDPAKAVVPGRVEGTLERATMADLGSPPLAALAAQSFRGGLAAVDPVGRRTLKIDADGRHWRLMVDRLPTRAGAPIFLVGAVASDEILADARRAQAVMLAVALGVIVLCLPLAVALARLVSAPLQRLAGEMAAVRRFDFSTPGSPPTLIAEVGQLRDATESMKSTIRRFLGLTATVAAEEDFERLLPRLLDETISATGARAGVLYLFEDRKGLLAQASARGAGGEDLAVAMPPLTVADADAALSGAVSARHASSGAIARHDAPDDLLQPLSVALGKMRTCHIAMPLANRENELLGLMLLAYDDEPGGDLVRFVEELSGTAAVSLEARQLIAAQKALFEAFIRLIAGAIDAKSPYTGGHCARVPELTKMLAKAACEASDGPYRDFTLTEKDWEAVHIAAWLHDCGKVTTPEYVVDKATKLETIYDRIHEIRMRFEVLKRDAEIAYWRAVAAGGDAGARKAELDATLASLDGDYAFVAACNEGGEFMAPERVTRLREIASRTWMRTLDDRIGISHEEKARKARSPAVPLPAAEPLIADKPEHFFERGPADIIPEDNPWGFRMQVPDHLYNRGELYNLAIGRGTLAEEDRYKINEHIVQTIVMLSQLPFPRHLRRVPEIAGGHHEKMDGTGYPKRLRREEMSPVARMMAIADIFEALTAVDRPYKKGKTLSEAVKIMSFMKKDHHVDPELFDLFLTSGVYLEYARRFLRPEQVDAVDVSAYVSPPAP